MQESQARPIEDVRHLTKEYASYSQSRSGLGNVLGGAVGALVFIATWLFGHPVWVIVGSLLLTVGWLAGKELLRARVYRRYGYAAERWSARDQRAWLLWIGFIAVCLLAFDIFVLASKGVHDAAVWPYLAFSVITPPLLWRYLRTSDEMVVGLALFFTDAIVASGHSPGLFALIWVPFSLILICKGWIEHRRFLQIITRLAGGTA